MSDGTLRALGVLVALFQPGLDGHISLVGLEERLGARMPSGYAPTVDQPRFAAAFSLEAARASASFRRCERLLLRLAEPFAAPAPP